MNILLVFQNPELSDSVRDILEKEVFSAGPRPMIDEVRNEDDAIRNLESRDYALIITHLHVPADRQTPLIEREERGLALLQSLREDETKIPGILVSRTDEQRLKVALFDLGSCYYLVQEGKSDWLDQLIDCCK